MLEVSQARLQLHFDVHQPIELVDLTISLGALASEYRSFLLSHTVKKISDDDVKLYITEIKNNCIWAELAGASALLGTLYSVMDYTVLFCDFTNRIKDGIEYFSNYSKLANRSNVDIPYSTRECENFSNFLGVVANNEGGKLGLSAAEFSGDTASPKASFTFTSSQAHDAKRGALLAKRDMEGTQGADYSNVIMYFHQTNIENPKAEGRTGDRAVIKSISPKPLRVYFVSQLDQERVKSMIDDPTHNPLKASYNVDVNVEVGRSGKPLLYRVIKLHSIIPDE